MLANYQIEVLATVIFALAVSHTFAAASFKTLAKKYSKHANLLHLLGEVEIIFGFWALVLISMIAAFAGGDKAVSYVASRQFTEPLFVFVIMVVAASKPILVLVKNLVITIANALPFNNTIAHIWLSLAVVPLLGSFITEPAAMTIAALMLAPLAFNQAMPEWLKYVPLATLFVNVSIGGTLTAYAAPPVLMVASVWQWDTVFMAYHFGWKAAVAVIINASLASLLLRKHVSREVFAVAEYTKIPLTIIITHLAFLVGIVAFSHQPVIFGILFLLFIGFTRFNAVYQSPLILKEGLLVGVFLGGLVILGGMQDWWLQPIVTALNPLQLFWGAGALTAITDNAALTYLGAQIDGLSDTAKYMLMAGAVTGGGLTIIANAPNPAGASLLKHHFNENAIHPGFLLLAALPPTLVAAALFLL